MLNKVIDLFKQLIAGKRRFAITTQIKVIDTTILSIPPKESRYILFHKLTKNEAEQVAYDINMDNITIYPEFMAYNIVENIDMRAILAFGRPSGYSDNTGALKDTFYYHHIKPCLNKFAKGNIIRLSTKRNRIGKPIVAKDKNDLFKILDIYCIADNEDYYMLALLPVVLGDNFHKLELIPNVYSIEDYLHILYNEINSSRQYETHKKVTDNAGKKKKAS